MKVYDFSIIGFSRGKGGKNKAQEEAGSREENFHYEIKPLTSVFFFQKKIEFNNGNYCVDRVV